MAPSGVYIVWGSISAFLHFGVSVFVGEFHFPKFILPLVVKWFQTPACFLFQLPQKDVVLGGWLWLRVKSWSRRKNFLSLQKVSKSRVMLAMLLGAGVLVVVGEEFEILVSTIR